MGLPLSATLLTYTTCLGHILPAGHITQASDALRPSLYVPAVHARQVVDPRAMLYKPSLQGTHCVWPMMGLYVPAAHLVHSMLRVVDVKVPTAHDSQTAEE